MTPPTTEAERLAGETTPLQDLESVCSDIFLRWDRGLRSGQLLLALCGELENYDPRATRLRALLRQGEE